MSADSDRNSSSFRDHLATADRTGKRIWVFPAKPKGRLHRARSIVAVGLLAFLFAGPFIKVGGQPILLLNILERKFIIFGLAFWPQDFHLFVLAAITLAVFVVLFTAVFGRLFCGWICPQTVFLEMVFRRIEYWIEGGPAKQRKLARQKWDEEKIAKRTVKHVVFYAISFLIGNTFLAYIIGSERLFKIMTDPPGEHIAGLSAMIIFSFLFYGVFAWFREQACTLVCPYGRLQSVLIDKNTIVVAYDHKRGEPRQPMERNQERANAGDCVECQACVHVCPTGIDIRNGTQLECVNCTACIDACNRTMNKVGLPEGLIRYSSEEAIAGGRKFRFTGRIGIYSVVLTILLSIMVFLFATRTDIETTILRSPGALFQRTNNGMIRNQYSAKVVNKTFDAIPVSFRIKSPQQATVTMVRGDLVVDPDGIAETAFFVNIPESGLFSPSTMIAIEVVSGERVIEEIRTTFMGPRKQGQQ